MKSIVVAIVIMAMVGAAIADPGNGNGNGQGGSPGNSGDAPGQQTGDNQGNGQGGNPDQGNNGQGNSGDQGNAGGNSEDGPDDDSGEPSDPGDPGVPDDDDTGTTDPNDDDPADPTDPGTPDDDTGNPADPGTETEKPTFTTNHISDTESVSVSPPCGLILRANRTVAWIINPCSVPIAIGGLWLSQNNVVVGKTPDGRFLLWPGKYVLPIEAASGLLRLTGVGGMGKYAECVVE